MEANSWVKVDLKLFASYFGPILLTFIGSRFIAQTDIIMLSPLGSDAVGAYSVPSRVMLLDMIVALALGPVVSVTMAKAKYSEQRCEVINGVFSVSIFLGLSLMLAGLLIYPYIVDNLVSEKNTASLAQEAVFYLTLAIPLRLAQFLGLMLIHGDGRGKVIVPLVLFTIIANAGLNWLFIYLMEFGFSGCYFATILTTAIELAIIILILSDPGKSGSLLCIPKWNWIIEMARKVGAEWGRLVSYQAVSLVTLAVFAMNYNREGQLEVFTLASELQALLLMPAIAVMRSTAIILASQQLAQSLSQIIVSMRDILTMGFMICFALAGLLLLTDEDQWRHIYGISNAALDWWHPFLVVLALTMPISLFNSIQRGAWQAIERYNFLFAVDFVVQWLVLLPCVIIGVYLANPWLTWAGWPLSELIASLAYVLRRRDLIARHEPSNMIDTPLMAQSSGVNGE
ncbi:MAG: hypothetical protein JAY90_10695 [Candidatus Thiodiazotropha lotti]|nr:hypothetical protein [Candidatus Thiodiazotropha lotti]